MEGQYISPFNRWNKNKIIQIINESGYTFICEDGGIFQLYYKENTFAKIYLIYLQKTIMCLVNQGVAIYRNISSYKKLRNALMMELVESSIDFSRVIIPEEGGMNYACTTKWRFI